MTWTQETLPESLIDLVSQEEFGNSEIFHNAFIHRSYLNEHLDFDKLSNERLEFLGDAVLQFLTSQFLYTTYPIDNEGRLTHYRSSLVNTVSLASISREMGLGKYLKMAKGEEASGGRDREYILANTFESLLGGLFLEKGLPSCKSLLEKVLFPKLTTIIEEKRFKDYKSLFQEKAQAEFGLTPIYTLASEVGPDHEKIFTVNVMVGDQIYGVGTGASKQKAEQDAAHIAMEKKWPQK